MTILIIGGGHAGGCVAANLRQYGCTDPIEIIGGEPLPPYQRPPLSKAWLKEDLPLSSVVLRPESFYEAQRIGLRLGRRAVKLDRERRSITLASGEVLAYSTLILAMGARARPLPVSGRELGGVHCLRTVADANALKQGMAAGKRLIVIGGGYVGLEAAASARSLGKHVLVIEREPRLLARVASSPISDFFRRYHAQKGVDILLGQEVAALEGADGEITGVRLGDGRLFTTDIVLIGIGAIANDEMARRAGLACDEGIIVDTAARTSDPDIYAIGDCTRRPLFPYGVRGRLESVANAVEQAKQAAAAICGRKPPTPEAPWFWSDQFDLRLQIAGLPIDVAEVVIRGDVEAARFAVVHLDRDGRPQAVEAVNMPAEFAAGRAAIAGRAMQSGEPPRIREQAPG